MGSTDRAVCVYVCMCVYVRAFSREGPIITGGGKFIQNQRSEEEEEEVLLTAYNK